MFAWNVSDFNWLTWCYMPEYRILHYMERFIPSLVSLSPILSGMLANDQLLSDKTWILLAVMFLVNIFSTVTYLYYNSCWKWCLSMSKINTMNVSLNDF
jgi:hypothetical protein